MNRLHTIRSLYTPGIRCVAVMLVAATLSPPSGNAPASAQDKTDFIDVSVTSGIDVIMPADLVVSDYGSGVAFVDFDNDRDLDLYLAMGHREDNRLYRQNAADRVFANVAAALGCADGGNGKGVKFADYDNDGDLDLFIGNIDGTNRLYRNEGGLNFNDVTVEAKLTFTAKTHGAAWGDYDNDGYLDLYVCLRNRGASDLLYHNNGDGTFTDVTVSSGVQNGSTSFEAVWIDYDRDGDQDIYVSVDGYALENKLYRNNGNGTFSDVSAASGAGVFIDGMGIAVGDYDNDGWEDLFVTNVNRDPSHILLRNKGDGTFEERSGPMGLNTGRYGWGTEFFDYDNDGDLDLYIVHWIGEPRPVAGNMLMRNDDSTFTNVTAQAGVGDAGSGFGLATGDYNNDGYIDMFVVNRGVRSVFYENTLSGNRWLKVQTLGRMGRGSVSESSNRDGIGARIEVTANGKTQIRVVRSGSSYLSMSSLEAEFGLAQADRVDVRVIWPSGIEDTLPDVTTDRTLVVCEGGWPTEFDYLRARASDDGNGIRLDWKLRCDNVVAPFLILRAVKTKGVFGEPERVGSAGSQETTWTDDTAERGATYRYVVAAIGPADGQVQSPPAQASLPQRFTLHQNYPNPFNPQTLIVFELTETGPVRLAVYTVRGALVEVLVDEERPAGLHEVVWRPGVETSRVSSATLFYRLETREGTITKKMTLLK